MMVFYSLMINRTMLDLCPTVIKTVRRIKLIIGCVFLFVLFGISMISSTTSGSQRAVTQSSSVKPKDSALLDLIITNDGTWDPNNFIDRYRQYMFPNADFYQWWYYSLKSPATSEYWAFVTLLTFVPQLPI